MAMKMQSSLVAVLLLGATVAIEREVGEEELGAAMEQVESGKPVDDE